MYTQWGKRRHKPIYRLTEPYMHQSDYEGGYVFVVLPIVVNQASCLRLTVPISVIQLFGTIIWQRFPYDDNPVLIGVKYNH